MQEQRSQLSRDALNDFLDFAGEKGLLKKATAGSRKRASNIILGILDDNEAVDLSKVDLENVIRRHRNLAIGKMTPKTLASYESRARMAVRDFIEYVKSPSSWSPGQQRTSRVVASTKKAETEDIVSKPKETPVQTERPSQPSVHIDFQIHISPEATPEQIDQIFDSMRRHLYGNTKGK